MGPDQNGSDSSFLDWGSGEGEEEEEEELGGGVRRRAIMRGSKGKIKETKLTMQFERREAKEARSMK